MGIDIGGTFTDAVLEAPAGRFTAKVLTTHAAPERGVLEAVRLVLGDAGLDPAGLDLIIHGTTLATNALIERKGARTAFLTTDGFRDTLEIATESRFDVYDVNLDLPGSLVARADRFEVPERMSARGVVLKPLDEVAVTRLIDEHIRPGGYESVAVGLIHGYANPAHERRIRELLADACPGVSVTLAAEVSPEMREYERFSTACANAYVQPLMASYLRRLEAELAALGIKAPLFLMLSGGGLTSLETAIRFPVRLVESGPAGGAIFSGHLATQNGLASVLSFDMGGTTAKICLIDHGKAQTARTFEVARVYRFKKGSGIPLRIPVIEMVEIGAGGGSIAAVDSLGRIAVGPESAGSEPGPACYGRGGTAPTVTDADVLLGRIDPVAFSGGRLALDRGAAERAVQDGIGRRLNLGAEHAAYGISEIVDTNMVNAARVHAIESGKDLAQRTLIAFGGAAPLHAVRVAEKLGMSRVLVPSAAGVGSCVGFLRAPIAFEVVRSAFQRLGTFDLAEVNALLAELRAEAHRVVERAAFGQEVGETRRAYMRYAGQGHEVVVPVPDGAFDAARVAAFKRAFETVYTEQYGRVIPGVDIEVISWSVTLSTPALAGVETAAAAAPHEAVPSGRRMLFDPSAGRAVEAQVYRRAALEPGARLSGPAVIVEDQTSTVVTGAFDARINGFGHIEIERRAGDALPAAAE